MTAVTHTGLALDTAPYCVTATRVNLTETGNNRPAPSTTADALCQGARREGSWQRIGRLPCAVPVATVAPPVLHASGTYPARPE